MQKYPVFLGVELTLQAKFGFLSRAWNQAINLTVIYYNVLPFLWELTRTWQQTYVGSNFQGEVRFPLDVSG